MSGFDLTRNEARRLAALRDYDVLDTASASGLDEVTALAARVCETPISLISLVDEKRLWIKSRWGSTCTELPRGGSFCERAILSDDLFVVGDARRHRHFADHPRVTGDPHLRFYAAAPLRAPEGEALGTLCVMDHRPRRLSAHQRDTLRVLGRHVMAQFDLRRLARASFDDRLAEPNPIAGVVDGHASLRRQRALLRGPQHLSALINSVNGIVWEADATSFRFTFVSPSAERLLGYPVKRWLEEPSFWHDHVHPDDREEALRYCLECTRQKLAHEFEYRMLAADGRIVWIRDIVTVVVEDGRPVALRGIMVDTTESKRTEAALRESEERFRNLAEHIQEVFWMIDPCTHHILYLSPAYEKTWGRPCANSYASAATWPEAVHPDDRARVAEAFAARLIEGAFNETYRIVRPDGTVRWIHDRGFPVRDSSGTTVRMVGTAEDITARLTLEDQVRHSQKMEAIGRLAGGVAHDFGNILSTILLEAEEASTAPSSADLRVSLHDIRVAAERAVELTRQLQAVSRRQQMQLCRLDVNDRIATLSRMLRRIVGGKIRLAVELHPVELPTEADPCMLDQVVLNLVVNARDAMPEGGVVSLETGETALTAESAVAIPDATPGRYVFVRVSDTGTGMSPELLPRIFEPFFTTKEPTQGTGFGLSTVFGIVKQHGGAIAVESAVGRGTTFRIFFRAAD